MRTTTRAALTVALLTAGPLIAAGAASAADTTPLQVPARTLPPPTADISPQMQAFIDKPLNPDWNFHPKTGEEWRAMADKIADGMLNTSAHGDATTSNVIAR